MSLDISGFITWVREFLDDIYQEKLVSGTNIKTINNNSLLGNGNISISGGTGSQNVFYGTSSTSAGTATKTVTATGWEWTSGNILFVKFTNENTYNGTAKIKIGSTSKDIATVGTTKTSRYHWKAGELVCFVYDGTNMLMLDQGTATKTSYGITNFSEIVDLIYPVNSIYMSVNSTSPATLFGGTWVALEGRFLVGVGSITENNVQITFAGGDTGGETTHTLTTDEMPSHNHGSKSLTGTMRPMTWNGTQNPSGICSYNGSNTKDKTLSNGSAVGSQTYNINATHTHDSNGGGQAHNNMPPYLAVYMWKRTA